MGLLHNYYLKIGLYINIININCRQSTATTLRSS